MRPVVLITGIAGGIGKATAELFSQVGWTVVGLDRQINPQLPCIDYYYQVDCTEPQILNDTFEIIQQQVSRLDTLINNAAIQVCKPSIEMSILEWDQIMAVNIRAAFQLSQLSYPLLKESQGSIVNVSSVHAIATSKNIAAYATSKGALVALSRALAVEWGSDSIRVNAVLPGAVETSMLNAGLNRGHLDQTNIQEQIQQLSDKTAMKRIGQPEEIAQSILFLADKQSSAFITGQTLVIDGGAISKLSTE